MLVEVVYALPDEQALVPLEVPEGCTVGEAIERSRLPERYPGLDPARQRVGIFGKLCKPDAVLHPGDRVEIYRPLIADPRAVRQQRAAEGKVMRRGGGRDGE